MPNRLPLAAVFFYVMAVLFALVGVLMVLAGLIGAGAASMSGPSHGIAGLLGSSLILTGLGPLISAGFFAAMGAVVHDIRRIAENTSSFATHHGNAAFLPPRPGPMAPKVEPVFFYFEKGVEHGPVSRGQLSALIHAGQVNVFQRIEKSVGGVRQPFEIRDLDG